MVSSPPIPPKFSLYPLPSESTSTSHKSNQKYLVTPIFLQNLFLYYNLPFSSHFCLLSLHSLSSILCSISFSLWSKASIISCLLVLPVSYFPRASFIFTHKLASSTFSYKLSVFLRYQYTSSAPWLEAVQVKTC